MINSNHLLTYGSLFSGVGGFDMGFDQAGFACLWQAEWDLNCRQTLAYHWPLCPKYGDVQDIRGDEISPVDVITFGSPCQDLSTAGKRDGIEGNKSGMFFEATRIIKEMRDATEKTFPRMAVWENVPGALQSNRGRDFGRVLDELANRGAVDIEWAVLDAIFFGVAARRRRVFVIANFDTGRRLSNSRALLPLAEVAPGYLQPPNGLYAFYRTHGKHDQPQEGIAPTLKTNAPICIAGTNRRPRMLSPIEHERLMGWPDNHTLFRADGKTNPVTSRISMCGNGVVTPVARYVARQIQDFLEDEIISEISCDMT
jgi:DNA (cytosine-5)-methyltransferase 1